MEDVYAGMKRQETLNTLGITADQADMLIERCKSGEINFVDFLSIMWILTDLSSDKSMVATMAAMQDATDTDNMSERLSFYKEMIEQMSPEERGNPGLLLSPNEDARARKMRIAQAVGQNLAPVDQFLTEFGTMRKMLFKLSTKDMDKTTTEMALERAEELTEGKSRRLRRTVKSTTRGKKPDWLNL